MKSYILYILLLSWLTNFSQNDYWLRVIDSTNMNMAIVDQNGIVKIPYATYKFILTDTIFSFAHVYRYDGKIVTIDRDDKFLFMPLIIDNLLPDIPSEGLFRIVDNDKIGFANMEGKIVIPAKFDAIQPFANNIAAFCVGCQIKNNKHGYGYWSGGKWGFINKKGEIVVNAIYDDLGFWNDVTVAKIYGIVYLLKKNGEIEKKLPSSAKPLFISDIP